MCVCVLHGSKTMPAVSAEELRNRPVTGMLGTVGGHFSSGRTVLQLHLVLLQKQSHVITVSADNNNSKPPLKLEAHRPVHNSWWRLSQHTLTATDGTQQSQAANPRALAHNQPLRMTPTVHLTWYACGCKCAAVAARRLQDEFSCPTQAKQATSQ